MDRRAKVIQNCADHILHRWKLGPRFGRSAHVIEDHCPAAVSDRLGNQCIECERARVVYDLYAERECLCGNSGFVGIDGDGDLQVPLQALEHGNQAAKLFGFGDALGARPRGLGTDIDDISSLLFHFDGASEGAVGVFVLAAVGKRVRRDVEDAHDERAVAQGDGTIGEFPDESLTRHEYLQGSLCTKRMNVRLAASGTLNRCPSALYRPGTVIGRSGADHFAGS